MVHVAVGTRPRRCHTRAPRPHLPMQSLAVGSALQWREGAHLCGSGTRVTFFLESESRPRGAGSFPTGLCRGESQGGREHARSGAQRVGPDGSWDLGSPQPCVRTVTSVLCLSRLRSDVFLGDSVTELLLCSDELRAPKLGRQWGLPGPKPPRLEGEETCPGHVWQSCGSLRLCARNVPPGCCSCVPASTEATPAAAQLPPQAPGGCPTPGEQHLCWTENGPETTATCSRDCPELP